jgi:hypothetical protein
MKTLIVLTGLVAGLALSQQASACDWMHQADQKPATVVTCENGTCTGEQATQAEAATTDAAPAARQTAEEPAPAPASPTIVAQGQ